MLFRRISIVGVGLIGGSIGLAIKKKKIAAEVTGIGRRRSSIAKAVKLGAVSSATLDVKKGVEKSDLIIVCTPVNIAVSKIKECARYAKPGAVIMDVTSVKAPIVEKAEAVCRKNKIFFVGAHPMAGLEESGVSAAKADLFKGAVCIITPTKSTNPKAFSKVRRFWSLLGSKIEIMPAGKHDAAVALISHLPHLIAYTICACADAESLKLAGPGFKDMTRIAKSNPVMWHDIFMANKKGIIESKNAFDREMNNLKNFISKGNSKSLFKTLSAAKRKRDVIG